MVVSSARGEESGSEKRQAREFHGPNGANIKAFVHRNVVGIGWEQPVEWLWAARQGAVDSYRFEMTIKAIVHPAEEGGFWAEVPALPGCVTQGETIEEVTANLKEAVEGWLEAGEPTEAIFEPDRLVELAL